MAERRGLLLDIGGVVHRTGIQLVGRLAEDEPAMKPVLDRIGGIASDRDELWQQVMRHQITEREYWAQRSAELGAALGQSWDTRALMDRFYQLDLPAEQIVFLDDMPWNVTGARQAGMTAVWVPWDDPDPAIDTARDLLGLGPRSR